MSEWPLLWGAGSEIWHWLYLLFGYVFGSLVNTMIRELTIGTLTKISRELLSDGWRQHSGTVKDSSIVRDVTPSTYIGVLCQFTRCHIKRRHSSYFSLWDPPILIGDYSLRTGCCSGRYCIGNSGWKLLSRYSDLLRVRRSGDRIPVWASFSSPVQTSPGAHPASCTMCTGSPSWG